MTPNLSGSAGQYAPADLIAFLASLPLVSRPIIANWFRQNPSMEVKVDTSPVTIADRMVEISLRATIAKTFPADKITGEEFGSDNENVPTKGIASPYRWIIDPIDGTKAFISGKPAFGTLVGLLYYDVPVAGLVDMPILDECYIGLNSFGMANMAQLNGVSIAANAKAKLANARLATTSPRALSSANLVSFNRLADQVAITNYGGDCHNYALLAAGHIDLVMEDSLAAHDIMAVAALMLAAGATVTDLAGRPIRNGQSTEILAAATPQLHHAALALILEKN
ncbi:histidinol phosphate phosphatase [Candidatus Puniceispirillum sp.]|nr:histidinol phosphate phosphatase [Candidatus Puniceispirillum sp.]